MKWLTPLIAAAVLLIAAPASAQIFDGDGAVTVTLGGDFVWLSDAPVEKIQGTAKGATGTFTTQAGDISKTTGTVTVPVGTMETGNGLRDKHLKGPDWLDAKAHPDIVFTIEGVDKVTTETKGDVKIARGMARGKIKIHGKEKAISVPITAKVKGGKVKIDMKFEVALADYAIEGSRGAVGKKVGETISITGSLKGAVK
jgi:polyisoprenoid-binding protein YceI